MNNSQRCVDLHMRYPTIVVLFARHGISPDGVLDAMAPGSDLAPMICDIMTQYEDRSIYTPRGNLSGTCLRILGAGIYLEIHPYRVADFFARFGHADRFVLYIQTYNRFRPVDVPCVAWYYWTRGFRCIVGDHPAAIARFTSAWDFHGAFQLTREYVIVPEQLVGDGVVVTNQAMIGGYMMNICPAYNIVPKNSQVAYSAIVGC